MTDDYFPLSISEIALIAQVHLDKQVSYKERASLKRISEALFIWFYSGYFLKINLITNDEQASALQPVHQLQQW